MDTPTPSPRLETATLAGGCFWCLEAAFDALAGVVSVESGYMGGHLDRPSYSQVCDGDTGHAEVVRITYDPARIGYQDLLDIFFALHDPTTPNRQGNDVGSQYRSAIFWHDAEQRRLAEATLQRLTEAGAYPAPIVTELAPATTFWPAEDYHRDYYRLHPNQPYCLFVVAPKLEKLQRRFAQRLKPL